MLLCSILFNGLTERKFEKMVRHGTPTWKRPTVVPGSLGCVKVWVSTSSVVGSPRSYAFKGTRAFSSTRACFDHSSPGLTGFSSPPQPTQLLIFRGRVSQCLAKPPRSTSGSRYSTSMTKVPFSSLSWIFWPHCCSRCESRQVSTRRQRSRLRITDIRYLGEHVVDPAKTFPSCRE